MLTAKMDPFAPITPAQENELIDLLAAGRGRLTKERLRKQLRGVTAHEAAAKIRALRGEPPVPVAAYVEKPASRARINELAESLDAHFACRRMQQHDIGLSQPSLYAGFNGNPTSMNR